MGLTKCCVGGCDATSDTHRVFCFPKIDWLRSLWMSFVVPTNSLLIGLPKDQLITKRVCQKHFDKTQFDEEGKRLRFAYPCLFTDEEMARGEPLLAPGVVHDVLKEHSYSKEQDDDEDLPGAVMVIGKPGGDFQEHPSCSNSEATQIDKRDGTINIAGQDLSVFFDPPHLLKGLRNNFVTKNIIWKGRTATWKDIQFIYDLDSQLGHTRALPKLTAHHVNPDKMKKMKVSVAAQVFSSRTAAMLKYTNALNKFHTEPIESMETTAEVVEFVDKLFDSVNCYPGGATRGKLRKAIKKDSPHHTFWAEETPRFCYSFTFKTIVSCTVLDVI